jgi:23S rRNA pseudouridine2605 synthase
MEDERWQKEFATERANNSRDGYRPWGSENKEFSRNGRVMRSRGQKAERVRVGYESNGPRERRPNRYGNDARPYSEGGYSPRQGYGRDGGYPSNRDGEYGGRAFNSRPRRRTADYNPNAKYNFQKQLKYKEVLADPNEPIRLNKFLSNAGVCSRREADEYIQAGVVKVNDQVVTELGTKITRQDIVTFNDQQVQIESKVYIVLNKPKNCVTTSDDPQERLTVMDLVKNACHERIYPVGRLDRNTTGVLLLTNDGDLASKLTHPSFKKKKIYHVWLDKNVSVEDMEKIANGLELEDGEIHADAISYANEDDKSQVGIEIHSGRNRIVRRIFESLGYHVVKLDRVYFAGLTKKNLGRGKWRYLNEREVNALRMGAFE